MVEQVFEALPVEASALVSSVQPLQQNLDRPAMELLNTDSVPIVIVIPFELSVQLRKSTLNRTSPFCLHHWVKLAIEPFGTFCFSSRDGVWLEIVKFA